MQMKCRRVAEAAAAAATAGAQRLLAAEAAAEKLGRQLDGARQQAATAAECQAAFEAQLQEVRFSWFR